MCESDRGGTGPWRLVAVEAIVLMVWWLWSRPVAANFGSVETWTLFSPYNVGSVLIQFTVVILVLLALNRWLVARIAGRTGRRRKERNRRPTPRSG